MTEHFNEKENLELEELVKACPRCGSASANKSNPSGRCRKHLSKLAADKKKPGHWQRAQTKADDALRRQKGKNGTAPGTSKGNGKRKEIVDKMQRAEKKTGHKLSPDRKDNGKGYSSKNVRAIPEHLNRGRHNADEKKIKEWKKKLKKHNLTTEELATLVLVKQTSYYEEALKKGKKELINMVKDQPEHHDKAKWIANNIHPQLQNFFMKNVRSNPELFNEENKQKLMHYSGMIKNAPKHFKEVNIHHDSMENGFNKLGDAENKWKKDNQNTLLKPSGKKLLDVGNGYAWYDLQKKQCEEEGAAMGHCGNSGTPQEGDTILSLRKEHKYGNNVVHEPKLTFINNSGYIGESKGGGNEKPHEKYHDAIAKLLSQPYIKGNAGGGYEEDNNFSIKDFKDPRHLQSILKDNPNFVDFNHLPNDENHLKHIFDKHKDVIMNSMNGTHNISKFSNFLTNEDVDRVVKEEPATAFHLKNRLTDAHIDHIVKESPAAAPHLKNRLTDAHIDHIIKESPVSASFHLKNRLTDAHIDHIVKNHASIASIHLKNRLTDAHIDHIIKESPATAFHLKNRLTDAHIDHIVKEEPDIAAFYLRDRLTDEQKALLNI